MMLIGRFASKICVLKGHVMFPRVLFKRLVMTLSSNYGEHAALRNAKKDNSVHNHKFKGKISRLFVPGHHGPSIYQIVKPFIDVGHLIDNIERIKRSCELRDLHLDFGVLVELAQKWKRLRDIFSVLEEKNDTYERELKRLQTENNLEEHDRLNSEHLEFLEEYKMVKKVLYDIEETFLPQYQLLPNCIHPKTPHRTDIYHYCHEIRKLGFIPSSHVTLGESMQWLEFSPVSPTAYFFKEKLSLLEAAIQSFFIHQLNECEFTNMICTDFCKSFIIEACGKDPHSVDDCIPLKTKGSRGGQSLNLVGSASLESFCAYLANININGNFLPGKYFSCGRFYDASQRNCTTKSLYNVVQSINIQCLVLSEKNTIDCAFDELLEVFHSCYFQLGIPFRMTAVSAKHLSVTESRRVLFEVWSPFFQKYFPCGHVSSRDDFVSKRLKATYGIDFKVHGYLHMVEAVAVKIPSLIACIMENFQNAEGLFSHPEVLKKYMLI